MPGPTPSGLPSQVAAPTGRPGRAEQREEQLYSLKKLLIIGPDPRARGKLNPRLRPQTTSGPVKLLSHSIGEFSMEREAEMRGDGGTRRRVNLGKVGIAKLEKATVAPRRRQRLTTSTTPTPPPPPKRVRLKGGKVEEKKEEGDDIGSSQYEWEYYYDYEYE